MNSWIKKNILTGFIVLCCLPHISEAAASYDGSMGTLGTLTGNFIVPTSAGKVVGNNLFHSFDQFNIATGTTATFQASANTQNIIARVTGGILSTLDGTLRSPSMANFYLLNPAGIVFNANANLDVKGAFYASTADYLRMVDGQKFSSKIQTGEVLSSSPPAAFGFLAQNLQTSRIQLNAAKLAVAKQQDILLIAPDISLLNGSKLTAAQGHVGLIASVSAGEVSNRVGTNAVRPQLGNISIRNSKISVSDNNGGGAIYIRAGQFMMDQSRLFANTFIANQGGSIDVFATTFTVTNSALVAKTEGGGNAGKINVLTKHLQLNGSSTLQVHSKTDTRTTVTATGSGGSIHINTDSMNMQGTTSLLANTFGSGQAGNIVLSASQSLNLQQTASIQAASTLGASGNAGKVNINAASMHMADASHILANSEGQGNAGHIQLQATSLLLSQQAFIESQALLGSTGNSGNIDLSTTLQLTLLDQSRVLANSRGVGRAGQIQINAMNSFKMDQSALIHSVSFGAGAAGLVTIQTKQLLMNAAANILVSAKGNGNAGGIAIRAQDILLSNGAAIQSTSTSSGHAGLLSINTQNLTMLNAANLLASSKGSGNAGNIQIDALRQLRLSANASIQSESLGTGQGGAIQINAKQVFLSSQSDIKASSTGIGHAGNIQINAERLWMNQQATISSSNSSQANNAGNAGDIFVQLSDELRMQNASSIRTEALQGGGGQMQLNAKNMLRMENSRISSQVANGLGHGGDINIDPRFVVLNNSIISANAVGGNGGNINIVAGNFVQSFDSQVTASSQFGVDGQIRIDSPEVDVSQGLNDLPVQFLDASQWAHQLCKAKGQSSFAIQKQNALAHTPDDWQVSKVSVQVIDSVTLHPFLSQVQQMDCTP